MDVVPFVEPTYPTMIVKERKEDWVYIQGDMEDSKSVWMEG